MDRGYASARMKLGLAFPKYIPLLSLFSPFFPLAAKSKPRAFARRKFQLFFAPPSPFFVFVFVFVFFSFLFSFFFFSLPSTFRANICLEDSPLDSPPRRVETIAITV